jgi:hypothetical protein
LLTGFCVAFAVARGIIKGKKGICKLFLRKCSRMPCLLRRGAALIADYRLISGTVSETEKGTSVKIL